MAQAASVAILILFSVCIYGFIDAIRQTNKLD